MKQDPRKTKIISCALHDFIEIACLYGYQIRLQLRDEKSITGRAIGTETTSDRREYLLLESAGKPHKIELVEIHRMQAITRNSQFDTVHF